MTSNEQIRIAVLGASLETGNMGVGALATGTIKCILSQYPFAHVSLLDYARRASVHTLKVDGKDVRVPLVNLRFSKRFYLANNIALLILFALASKLIPFGGVRRRLLCLNACLREVLETDLVASIAGGDSFSDIYGLERLLYVALPQILVLILGKTLLLLPQTIGPFKSRFSKLLARYILNRAGAIYSRDLAGVDTAQHIITNPRVRRVTGFCYDVGFVVPPSRPESLNIEGVSLQTRDDSMLVGMNVSGLLFMGGYSRNNMFGLQLSYPKLVHALLDFLITGQSARVLLVPHVFGDSGESDMAVSRRLFQELAPRYPGKLGWVAGEYGPGEIKYIIGQCDAFVGSRMHACIAAVSQCVPAVSVAYSDKFVGVMDTVGAGALVADARKMGQEEVIRIVRDMLDGRESLRRQLEANMPEVRARVLRLFQNRSCSHGDPRLS
ncbi:MAG: polysaccharide pyruvyl transferase family protein [Terriglobia bacterium]|jgi:polysaccharide pyruvyl transferase WcaK-like protein